MELLRLVDHAPAGRVQHEVADVLAASSCARRAARRPSPSSSRRRSAAPPSRARRAAGRPGYSKPIAGRCSDRKMRAVRGDLGPRAVARRARPRPRRRRRSRARPRSPVDRRRSTPSSTAPRRSPPRDDPGTRAGGSTPAAARPSRSRSRCRPRGRAARGGFSASALIRRASRLGQAARARRRRDEVDVVRRPPRARPAPPHGGRADLDGAALEARVELVDGLVGREGLGVEVEVAALDLRCSRRTRRAGPGSRRAGAARPGPSDAAVRRWRSRRSGARACGYLGLLPSRRRVISLPNSIYRRRAAHATLQLRRKVAAHSPDAFIAPTAVIIGDVTVEENASVWYNTVCARTSRRS